jgi:oligoribonuclease
MEMSGLDPFREKVLEIATIITNGNLVVVATGPRIVIHQPEEVLLAMDAWNKEHHGGSGLLEEVRRSTVTTAQAEEQTLEFISSHCPRHTAPLAGNSVHQDRVFLGMHMPRLHDWFHYRNVDVSTVKELVSRWYPDVFRRRPNKKGNHRAHQDILESIAELAFYRDTVFQKVG